VIFDWRDRHLVSEARAKLNDFGGAQFEGCNELLTITRPDVVASVHASFFDVGVDVVETNTFGAFAVPLGEYGIANRSHELNVAAARIARGIAADYSTPNHPRWVAGSIGPGTKFPSLGDIRYSALRDAYECRRQASSRGVDLFIIETMFDLLTLKQP
jgi:5-methyltetrahydrofolate--homocysteine methyltransferase